MLTSEEITSKLEQISELQIVKCAMHHEGVVLDSEGNPKYTELDGKIIFNRVPLCNSNIRKTRLGCAHGSANRTFEQLVRHLIKAYPKRSTGLIQLQNILSSVINKIYATDHKMGFLEHDLALCLFENNEFTHQKLLQKRQDLRTIHDGLLDQLQIVKSDIEMFIRKELKNPV